jgi:hypothetical protein
MGRKYIQETDWRCKGIRINLLRIEIKNATAKKKKKKVSLFLKRTVTTIHA